MTSVLWMYDMQGERWNISDWTDTLGRQSNSKNPPEQRLQTKE